MTPDGADGRADGGGDDGPRPIVEYVGAIQEMKHYRVVGSADG